MGASKGNCHSPPPPPPPPDEPRGGGSSLSSHKLPAKVLAPTPAFPNTSPPPLPLPSPLPRDLLISQISSIPHAAAATTAAATTAPIGPARVAGATLSQKTFFIYSRVSDRGVTIPPPLGTPCAYNWAWLPSWPTRGQESVAWPCQGAPSVVHTS